jgi:hypothetical protein
MIDATRLIQKTASYAISTSGAVTDPVLMEVATQYQTNVAGKMIALKPEDLPKRYTGSDALLAMVKYDGEGVFVYFDASRDSQRAFAFNAPSGRVRVGVPAVDALGAHLAGQGIKKALLRCELYLPSSVSGKRNSSSDVARASFSTDATDHAAFRLAVLDIIMIDGTDWRAQQASFGEIWTKLAAVVGDKPAHAFHRPEGHELPENELAHFFEREVKAGQEGLVVRRLNRPEIVKVKPHLTFDTVVIGYVEKDLEGEVGIASILTALTYPNANGKQLAMQVFARVGSGMDDAQRKALHAQLQPLAVASPIAMTDSDGRPVVFVKPQHVLEIEADDIVSAVRNEKENVTQFLSWDGTAYAYHRQATCPRVSFPIFGRLRPDKTAESGAQMTQLVESPVTPPMEPVAVGQTPSIVRREVYRKDGKAGDTALRKLVLVQRHEPDGYAYVVYWTDYSSKRKDPLKVSTQFALTRGRADALAAKLLEENISKGFAKVEKS